MKDKEKQIEEMAKVIDDRLLEARGYLGSMNKGEGYWIAQKLVEHYQPKLPEDSVVLTREEIDSAEYFYVQDGELKLIEKGRGKFITNEWYKELLMKMPLGHELAKERKETAEKILNVIHKELWDEKTPIANTFVNVDIKVRELVKQFGVEIKE